MDEGIGASVTGLGWTGESRPPQPLKSGTALGVMPAKRSKPSSSGSAATSAPGVEVPQRKRSKVGLAPSPVDGGDSKNALAIVEGGKTVLVHRNRLREALNTAEKRVVAAVSQKEKDRLAGTDRMEERINLSKSLSKMEAAWEERAYEILFHVFPRKVIELDELSRSPIFSKSPADIVVEIDVGAAATVADGIAAGDKEDVKRYRAMIPSNPHLDEVIAALKRLILGLSRDMSALSLWINLNVPRMESANFAADIQGEIMGQIGSVESSALAVLDSFTTYHLTRGGIVAKLLKYPGVENYHKAIAELDMKEYTKAQTGCTDLRAAYIQSYSLLLKNLERIEQPLQDNVHQRLY